MISLEIKIKCFEYLTLKFTEWFKELENDKHVEENFNKLKLIKLNFFVSAVNADLKNDGLLHIFNKFYALPYGHVESDIYDHMDSLKVFRIGKHSIEIFSVESEYFNPVQEYKDILDRGIESLREKNEDLVLLSALDLVELSHEWQSWRTIYETARSLNKFSLPIPKEMIKKESKFFSLKQSPVDVFV